MAHALGAHLTLPPAKLGQMVEGRGKAPLLDLDAWNEPTNGTWLQDPKDRPC